METNPLVCLMADNTPVGLVLLNTEHEAVFINKAIEQMSGIPKEDLMGNGFLNRLFIEQMKFRLTEKITECMQKPFSDLNLSIRDKENRTIFVTVHGNAYTHDGTDWVILSVIDITRQKAYEKVFESSFDNFIQTTLDLDSALKKIKDQQKILEDYKRKITRELAIAKNVQKLLLPSLFPSNEYIDIYGISIPSGELGGDYFDFFHLDQHRIGILIADVSGHGVPSSLISSLLKSYFAYYVNEYTDSKQLFFHINNAITSMLKETGFFLTAFYTVIDYQKFTVTCVNAGHPAALWFHPDFEEPKKIGIVNSSPIIGVFDNIQFSEEVYPLLPKSRIFISTDGITEARNMQGEFYGTDRMVAFINKNWQKNPKDCLEKLIMELDYFYGKAEANDDRTAIVIDIHSKQIEHALTPIEKGKKFLEHKQFTEALEQFTMVIQNPEIAFEAYTYLGFTYTSMNEWDNAIQALNKALELKPGYFKALYYFGILHYVKKEFSQAVSCFEQVQKNFGNYKNTEKYLENIAKQ